MTIKIHLLKLFSTTNKMVNANNAKIIKIAKYIQSFKVIKYNSIALDV